MILSGITDSLYMLSVTWLFVFFFNISEFFERSHNAQNRTSSVTLQSL